MTNEDMRPENGEDTPVREVHTTGFPCKHCGSQMIYDPGKGTLVCSYCKGEEAIASPTVEAQEYSFYPNENRYEAPHWETRGTQRLVCPSCGAETLMNMAAMTAKCPFCGAHYVAGLDEKEREEIISPETMMPFRVPEADARQSFRTWVKKKKMAPRAFRRSDLQSELTGVYVPYWTFDAFLTTTYRGEGGIRRTEHYTVVRDGKTEHRTRTVTDWFPIWGDHQLSFDDYPCPATRKIDRKMLDKVGPFELKMLNVYNPAFLAGFLAERYSVGLAEGFDAVRRRMESEMESAICAKVSRRYDTYRFMHYDHHFETVHFKHILLPVWLSSYTYGNKIYQFLVNGETGKVAGRAPVSFWKVAAIVLGSLAAVAALVLWAYFS